MRFEEMKYERPDYERVSGRYEKLLKELEEAKEPKSFVSIFRKIDELKEELSTMSTLAFVRHSIDTRDEFYDKENEYWDETNPLYAVYDSRLSKICVECPFREELYEDIPEVYFKMAECQMKSFSEEIVPLLQEENKLASEYGKLKASAQIDFEGKTYNLSSISPLMLDKDKDVRRRANDAKIGFYEKNEAEFDRIYDGLVKVRTKIAKTLGYSSFTELAYLRMMRLDYDRDMVANYRKQILEDIVPAVSDLYKRQARRLGTEKVAYYDKGMEFLNGNPSPKGTKEELIKAAQTMYHEMSKETGEFIDVMIENDLWDLDSKDGKQMGGYCTSIPAYKVPFIFA
ncbi:MAG: M3 family oligoendopeptidase, partial [Erysipelotrichaceae bacterium]|nr:M3 family oligoendopeptidase [Erysipelotrichaceae bacterium]